VVPEDVYELVTVSDPRVSPDARLVAYVVTTVDREDSRYRSAIWVVPVDGSDAPRQFTFGPKADTSPRWSADGTRLAFVSARGDDKAKPQLFVIPAEGGEALQLTDLEGGVEDPKWSPDGSSIAFCARVPDDAYCEEDDRKRPPRRITRLKYRLDSVGWTFDRPKHVFVVAADGSSEPGQVTDGPFEDAAPAWSPDGREIAFVSARHRNWDVDLGANDVFVVGASGGRPKRLTHTDGAHGAPSWSPDGRRIAHTFRPGREGTRHAQIAVTEVAGGRTKILTRSLDRNCAPFITGREPIWIDDDYLLFAVEDGGNDPVYVVRRDGSEDPRLVRGGEFRLGGYDHAAGVGVHVRSTPTQLPELYFRDNKLTEHGAAFVKNRNLVEPERFTATSRDGSEVDAWIMRPAGFRRGRRYPVLLNIHGGPFTQYGNGFFDEFQVYARAGYVVVFGNPRGSSGYSEAWGAAINGPELGGSGWGSVDYEDVTAVIDDALRRYRFCDPDRVGVIGGSYGGYMTSWIVSHTNRFKAACSERAVNAWHSMHGSSDFGWPFTGQFGVALYDDPDEWARISPITYAKAIRTPLLILHSENDLRCPIEQAEQLFTILRLLKRDVEFVRFPAESHELSRSGSPVHRVQRFEVVLDWFDRKL
jgi:dipeptidyl aminopeptidase/acylaminoacyl peptidase